MRSWWVVGAFALGSWTASASGPPGELRVRSLVVVDEEGRPIGRFGGTVRGAELVVGGASQVSLVTDGGLAALNLVGEEVVVRELPTDTEAE